jgi:hypothetical protein
VRKLLIAGAALIALPGTPLADKYPLRNEVPFSNVPLRPQEIPRYDIDGVCKGNALCIRLEFDYVTMLQEIWREHAPTAEAACMARHVSYDPTGYRTLFSCVLNDAP